MTTASIDELRRRISELERELARLGDDVRANRTSSIAALNAEIGDHERAAETYLAAARHCMTTGHALRAAVLARSAYRAAPPLVREAALAIWQQCSGESDSEFFAPTSAN